MSNPITARLAAAHARLRTIGVTGTNGKTTTTSMIAAIVTAAGEPAARVTTLGAWVADERIAGDNLAHEYLLAVERAVERGVATLAVEMTSKALASGFARTWRPAVGIVTNFTRDHLDFHGSPEAYLAAKAQLVIALAPGGTAVLNADDPTADLLAELAAPGVTIRRFSTRGPASAGAAVGSAANVVAGDSPVAASSTSDAAGSPAALVASRIDVTADGTRIALAPGALADRLDRALVLRVVGAVHAQNALAAALATDALGYPADAIARGLATFAGVPGRFEIVARAPLVVVDYAHTPDGLTGTLATARALVAPDARVICVFGCGGNRDRGKRPEMGAIADAAADLVVLTSDNPRREDPRAIATEILAGAPHPRARWIIELDRARAIEAAIAAARPADIVVIAGKGHEQTQEIGDTSLPFSDAAVARRFASAR